MSKLFAVVLFFLMSSPSFALHATNCSTGDGKIKRVEHEIWGANDIDYEINGKTFNESDLKVTFSKKMTLASHMAVGGGTETYTAFVTISKTDGSPIVEAKSVSAHVICDSWWNSALD